LAAGDEDSHSPGQLFDTFVRADKKISSTSTGWSQMVTEGGNTFTTTRRPNSDPLQAAQNAHPQDRAVARMNRRMIAKAEQGKPFTQPPGIMAQIIAGRRAGRDRV
jgi:hypothetical protein